MRYLSEWVRELCCYCGKFDAQADGLCDRCYRRNVA